MAMKKVVRKLNNSGVSLIEILVSIAIIIIVAAPLINTFLEAIKTDSSARVIQNGTTAAQTIAEKFKSYSLDELKAEYSTIADYKEENGKYIFENISITGADGEEFVASVVLDPSTYSENVSNGKIDVNDVELPVFSGLYGSDSIMLYRQYASMDSQVTKLFEAKGVSLTEEQRKKVSKNARVDIDCNRNSGKYIYDVSIEVEYYCNDVGVTTDRVTKVLEKTYDENQIQNIYMICPIFDLYTKDGATPDYVYNSDKISIYYSYRDENGTLENQPTLYMYIAEQDAKNLEGTGLRERINPRNLWIGTQQYIDYNSDDPNNKLKIYTNIGDGEDTIKNDPHKHNLTYGDYNTGTALYSMMVTVKEAGKPNVVARFNTSK